MRDFRRDKFVFLSLALVLAINCSSQLLAADVPPDVKSALTAKIGEMMPLLAEGKVDEFLQRVGATNDPDRDYYDTMRQRISAINDYAGRYLDCEVAGYKSLTSRYHVIYVMAYYQKLPVMFEFGFYKVENQWQPLKLRVDSNFQTILDLMPMQKP